MDSTVNPANNPTDSIPEAKQPAAAGSSNNTNVTKRYAQLQTIDRGPQLTASQQTDCKRSS